MSIGDLGKKEPLAIGKNLLVIEEKATTFNEVAVSALAKEGFKVMAYSNHLEALARLDELKPDLIILGEGRHSYEACRQLRQAIDIPILMLGKISCEEGWVMAVEAGADLYLVKPVSYLELIARMKAVLRRWEWTLIRA